MREIELDILANSRLAISTSHYFPLMVGCIIISTLYGVARLSWINLLFMWIWLALAGWAFFRYNKSKKRIMELRKNGSC